MAKIPYSNTATVTTTEPSVVEATAPTTSSTVSDTAPVKDTQPELTAEAGAVTVPAPTPVVVDRVTLAVKDLLVAYKSLALLKTPSNEQLREMAMALVQIVNYGIDVKKNRYHKEVMEHLYEFIKDNINGITNDSHLHRGFNFINTNFRASSDFTGRIIHMLAAHAKGSTDYVWIGLKSSVTPAIFNALRQLVKAK